MTILPLLLTVPHRQLLNPNNRTHHSVPYISEPLMQQVVVRLVQQRLLGAERGARVLARLQVERAELLPRLHVRHESGDG